MKVNYLEWDSQFFGFKVGEIEENDMDSIKIGVDDYQLLYLKQKEDIILDIPDFTNSFQESKLDYIKTQFKHNDVDINILDFDKHPIESYKFYPLAYLSGHYSRFFLDKKFGENKFKQLYELWVDNSLSKQFAKKIFYIIKNKEVGGFVTVQTNDKSAKIGLIAVEAKHQGFGIGKQLLSKVENYCIENNMQNLVIPTQETNIQACQFYKKAGYDIHSKIILKHYWKNEKP